MGTKEEKIKYLLFNRRRIGKFENGGVYIRDIKKHTWEYSSYVMRSYQLCEVSSRSPEKYGNLELFTSHKIIAS